MHFANIIKVCFHFVCKKKVVLDTSFSTSLWKVDSFLIKMMTFTFETGKAFNYTKIFSGCYSVIDTLRIDT